MRISEAEREIQRQGLRKVIRFFGSVQDYADAVEVLRSCASNWANQGNAIPFDKAVITEELSKVPIHEISPCTPKANDIIKRLRSQHKLLPVEMPIDLIRIPEPHCAQLKQNRPVLIDHQGILIAGLEQLKAHKATGMKKIMVIVLDL